MATLPEVTAKSNASPINIEQILFCFVLCLELDELILKGS